MATYSTNLGLILPSNGEFVGSWDVPNNTNIGTLIEETLIGSGAVSFSSDADTSISITNGVSSAARCLVLAVTSSVSLTTTRNLVVPTINKEYVVYNNTSGGQSIVVKTSGGTGMTIPNGGRAFVYADGTNVVAQVNTLFSGAKIGASAILTAADVLSNSQTIPSGGSVAFSSGSVLDIYGTETIYSGGSLVINAGATETVNSGGTFAMNGTETHASGATEVWSSGGTETFNLGSILAVNGSETHASGATTVFSAGSTATFNLGSILAVNGSETHASGATTVFSAGSTETFNSGATLNILGTLDASGGTLIGFGSVPAGIVAPYAGSSAPTGWLLCYGQAISRTTYADLFTAISTNYGSGDGSTTFNVPDLRGRVAAGKDNMGGSAASRLTSGGSGVNGAALNGSGGAETHTLTTAQLPAHDHAGAYTFVTIGSGWSSYTVGAPTLGAANPASVGSGSAHNNAQPTLILNYIIKT